MNFLDVRTVVFSNLITDIVCAAVLGWLWIQNRKRFGGSLFWLADLCLQTLAVLMISLRGRLPDWLSLGSASPLAVGGALLGYLGLERFTGKKSVQLHNYILLLVFILLNSYYAFIRPSLEARNLLLSLALLAICFQCTWLIAYRVDRAERRKALWVGLVFGLFCLVSLVRIGEILAKPQPDIDFFQSGIYETLILMFYQILLILLTFSLVMLVNHHLIAEAQSQEEKFTRAFHSSPYAILLAKASDGRILEVNDGFAKIVGYSTEEAAGKTSLELHLWAREADRAGVDTELAQGRPVHGREFEFRKKSGQPFTGLFSAETVTIDDQPWILSSISDISERKQAQEQTNRMAKFPSENPNPTLRLDRDGAILYANPASQSLLADWGAQVGEPAPEFWQEIVAQALEQQTTRTYETKCGEIIYSFSVVPVMESHYVNLYGRDITKRKQVEQTLIESEKRYRSLFENMLNGYAYCRMLFEDGQPQDFIYLDVNQAFEKLTGLKQAAGRKVSELIPGLRQSDPELFERYARVALSGEPETFETYVEALKMWFSISVYSPEREYFVAVFDVITERKQAEKALRESESRYRHTLEAMLEGCQILGLDWRYLYINEAAEKQNRRPKEELLGRKYADMWPGIESTQVFEALRQCMQERTPQSLENEFVFPDGSKGYFDLRIYPVPEGLVILSIDVTSRKQAEADLVERESRYRELVENANSAIIRWKSDGTIAFFNDFAESFFGYPAEEIIGRDVNILVPETESTGGDLSTLVHDIVSQPERFVNIINENICRDGRRVWMTWTNKPIRDRNGQVTEILAVGNDITRAEKGRRGAGA